MMENQQLPVHFVKRQLSYLICILLAGQPVFPVFAAPTPANNATQMDQAGNGVPVVNIATPNGAGISHNQFQDYNVGKEGIILNNATGQLNSTQLGGLIQNNPSLKAGQEARGIINEVTGANRSQLQGYTEVAGKAANVMVANPYGITCNGCGFINTPNATLTTGKPVFDASGNLQALDVKKGSITVEGEGLDASSSDALSIISRATEVNAAIHAKDLKVIAGANRVGTDGSVQAQQGVGNAPTVAVDTGALGGMYANRIHLVSSDKGVGVNLGNLNARQGDITLDASGRLAVKNSLASGSTVVKGESITLSGEHKASGALSVSAQNDISVSGAKLASDGGMTLKGNGQLILSDSTLTTGGSLGVETRDFAQDSHSRADAAGNISLSLSGSGSTQGQLVAGNDVVLNAGSLDNSGSLISQGSQQLHTQRLTNSGILQSQHNLLLEGGVFSNTGQMASGGTFDLYGTALEQNGTLSAAGQASLTVSGVFTSGEHAQTLSDNTLQVTAGSLQQNGTLSAQAGLTLSSGTLLNTGDHSVTTTRGNLSLEADNASLGGEMTAHGSLDLQAGQFVSRTGAQVQSENDLSIRAREATLDGTQVAKGALKVTASHVTHNGKSNATAITFDAENISNGGTLVAPALSLVSHTLTNVGLMQGQDITLKAHDWDNGGVTTAQGALDVALTGTLTNSGTVQSQQDATLTTGSVTSTGKLAAEHLQVTTQHLDNNGLLQGNSSLQLSAPALINRANGQVVSGAALTLVLQSLNNAGLLQVDDLLTLTGDQMVNSGDITANAMNLTLSGPFANQSGGRLLAQKAATFTGGLDNDGIMAGDDLVFTGDALTNSGTVQGKNSLTFNTRGLSNPGQILSGGSLSVTQGALVNAGTLQGDTLALTADSLTNTGTLYGVNGISGTFSGAVTNDGQIRSQKAITLGAGSLRNTGKILGQSLSLQTTTLTSDGLLQGSDGLNIQARDVTVGSAGQALTGGLLTLDAGQLANDGLLQGAQDRISADNWRNRGAVVATGDVNVSVDDTLTNSGDILSKGGATVQARMLANDGSLLSEGDMTLDGTTLNNRHTIQGDTLTLHQPDVTNQGTLVGLNALTFAARIAMATPQRTLINMASGQLLTRGTLTLDGGDFTSHGSWQGQRILLTGNQLENDGAIQSAGDLSLTLSDTLNAAAGSKITANGSAALQALSLTNNGQWTAQSLSIKGSTLNNNGDISGVNGLALTLDGTFTQQQDKTLLTGGMLTLHSASVSNLGRIQGNETHITSGALDNQGRIQGRDGLTLMLNGALTNRATGVVLSQNALNITAPDVMNDGILQGETASRIDASGTVRNDGRLLFAGDLALNTTTFTNSNWIQATNLQLNAAQATNSGTLLADQQASLTGNQFTNTGMVEAGGLLSDYQTLTNSGTLLGHQQLTVTADQATVETAGNLFSGGDILLNVTGFDAPGKVVALGNLTVNLVNAFIARNVMAAGKVLALTSKGDISNQSVMQGQGLNIHAGGAFSNDGQLTAGQGASDITGSHIAMNAAGSLQSGGDVTLTSAGDLTVDGFTGTGGSLTLNAIGKIVNTALLYAGNNLTLYGNSIRNNRGDILAGNNLVMQKDAAGTANTEIINTSGTIETQKGDITLRTAHLLNEREGLNATQSTVSNPAAIPGLGNATITVPVNLLPDGSYGVWARKGSGEEGPCGTHSACNHYKFIRYTYAPFANTAEQKFVTGQTVTLITSTGGAARMAAGHDLVIHADTLDNVASHLLATGDIALSGNKLSNQSWQAGTLTDYLVYQYQYDKNASPYATSAANDTPAVDGYRLSLPDANAGITYQLVGHDSAQVAGDNYRSVIQAGGNVSANFTQDISNTTTTANTGGITGTLSAPSLNTLSNQSIGSGVSKQRLFGADQITVGSPQWQDQLQNALQQINGGESLESNSAAVSSLDSYVAGGKGSTRLDASVSLSRADAQGAVSVTAESHQGTRVDTSAYPLPQGQNGYFVTATDPKSPYLIVTNPKLDGLGQLDPSLFGELSTLLGNKPGDAPRETHATYTDQNQFLGSAYFMDRLDLHPEYDYRFLGDAAFDTRYVSNFILNQTGSRYINGIGSDLAQMQYLMDNAADAQKSLGLISGIALTAEQIAALDHSMLWWEAVTINGETVMVPKVYLSPNDVTVRQGSVIGGNNVQLAGGTVTNDGSTVTAQNSLSLNSDNSISNLNRSLMNAGGNLQLDAVGDINNVGSVISGKTVALESTDGSITNLTLADTFSLDTHGSDGQVSLAHTSPGETGTIRAQDDMSLSAGKNISITGADVAAGGNLLLKAWGDIAVTANQVTDHYSQSGFHRQAATDHTTTGNAGSTLTAGGNLDIQAGHDITAQASALSAGNNTTLAAGNDLNLNAAQTGEQSRRGNSETHSSGTERTTVSAGGDIALAAGQDINSQAAGLAAEGDVTLQAGRDINLLAAESTTGDSSHSKNKQTIHESVRQQGTEIASGGDTTITAGRDVNSEAAQVTASGDIGVAAGHDISLSTATESDYAYQEETKTHKGLFSKTTTHTIKEDASTREAGSLLSGNNVTLQAGHDLTVEGSAVAGDAAVSLSAKNNVAVVAATDTDSTYRLEERHKSGLMGTGGIGITVGSNRSRHEVNDNGTTQSQSVSTVGSTEGNLSITAGGQVHAGGADLIAGHNLSVSGDSVIIEPGHDRRTRDEKTEQKQSGMTLALSGAAGEAINQAVSAAQAAKSQSDGRLAALQATKSVLSGIQANLSQQQGQVSGDPNDGIGISLSLSTQKSQSQSHQASDAVSGSTLTAGHDLSVTATGTGAGTDSGDIGIAGSQLKAAGDTTLNAQRDLLLSGAANTQQTTGKNSSSGGAVGISFGVGHGSGGLSIFASGNAAKGNEKGNGTQWSETTVDSGGTVAMTSGRDTTLTGAQVSGQKVTADVGRDLTLTSQQDSDRYNAQQQSVSGGASFTFGSMTASGGLSVSQDKTRSNYDSVQEQTGIYAGKGGFDIFTGNHTQLNGAVIASTATADKNSLDTGTLGFNDIHNQADYKTQHIGVSVGAGSGMTGGMAAMQAGQNLASNLLAGMNSSGHAEGTTQAAVADGNITVRDTARQQQDVADLSRDTEHANDTISPIFDKEKEQQRLQTVQLISDISGQVTNIYRTQGDIDGLKAAKDSGEVTPPGPGASAKEQADYLDALRSTPQYEEAVKHNGIGSDSQKAVQAVTGVLTGLAGGNLQAAVAGGMNPYVAEQIKHYTGDNVAVNALAHAVWGGIAAEMAGNDATAGAVGAAGGELATRYIAEHYYGADTEEKRANLSERDKQELSLLGTLAAGLAGGVAGDSSSSASAGAQAGKNAIENNALSEAADYLATGKKPEDRYKDAQQQLKDAVDEFKAKNCAGLSAEACGAKMDAHRDELLAGLADAGSDFIPVYGDIKSFAEADSALGYLAAVVGILPGLGDEAGALLKGADKALKGGDLEAASKLIARAGDDISSAKYFGQERKFWSAEPVEFSGNKVYQRNDLFDPQQVSSWKEKGQTVTGTNVERMASGRAPIGTDGKSVNLHHMTQSQNGPIAEVTQSFHQENSSVIHINPNTTPSGINRPVFDKWKSQYWQQRAAGYGK